jgi:hypothetical protein
VRAQEVVERHVHARLIGRCLPDDRRAHREGPNIPTALDREAAEPLAGRSHVNTITERQGLCGRHTDLELPDCLARYELERKEAPISDRHVHERSVGRRSRRDRSHVLRPDLRPVGHSKRRQVVSSRRHEPALARQHWRGQSPCTGGPGHDTICGLEYVHTVGRRHDKPVADDRDGSVRRNRRLPDFRAVCDAPAEMPD